MSATVQIKNLLAQSVKISLHSENSKRPVEVTLQPHETLPNPRRPYAIGENDITVYTEGLVARKFLRVRKSA